MLNRIVLYFFVLFCIVLHCIVVYCIVLHSTVFYYILLYFIVLYCITGTSVAYKVAGVAVVAYVIALVYEVPHLSVLTENAAVFAIQALCGLGGGWGLGG